MAIEQKKRLALYLKYSLIGHLVLFVLVILANLAFPDEVKIFMPSVQIDVVALPDLLKNQATPTDLSLPVKNQTPPPPSESEVKKEENNPAQMEAPQPEPKPSKKSEVAENKKLKENTKTALDRLRNLQKKKQQEERKAAQENLNKRQEDLKKFEETFRQALKGNQLNSGSSVTGSMQDAANAYFGHIREKLYNNWGLPSYLQGKGLRAEVAIYLDEKGNLIRYRFTQFSGNEVFDNNVKAAIQRAAPFAPPPDELSKVLKNSGIGLQFPL